MFTLYWMRLKMKGTFPPLVCFAYVGIFPQLLVPRHVQEDDVPGT